MDDRALFERLRAEMRDWYRILGKFSPGAGVLELAGVGALSKNP